MEEPASSALTLSKRRKDLFGECGLIEIIHLHDCLRGALKALERDVGELSQTVLRGVCNEQAAELERRVAGRFRVIWSVFRAHSSAEDEYIWPALSAKTKGQIRGSPKYSPGEEPEPPNKPVAILPEGDDVIEQEEYEEDHALEECMFSKMDGLLTKLRHGLLQLPEHPLATKKINTTTESTHGGGTTTDTIHDTAKAVRDITAALSEHLMAHLAKEETQCLPLVVKHLNNAEIDELVGKIMGKRSSDTMSQILSMAVQNLNDTDREEMVRYMKQAMVGTFFERWLAMSGWLASVSHVTEEPDGGKVEHRKRPSEPIVETDPHDDKRSKAVSPPDVVNEVECEQDETSESNGWCVSCGSGTARAAAAVAVVPPEVARPSPQPQQQQVEITSQTELEKLIRAIATNPELTPAQKNTTIQGLRNSVWKRNQRQKLKSTGGASITPTAVNCIEPLDTSFQVPPATVASSDPVPPVAAAAAAAATTRVRRVTPPSAYYKRNEEGKLLLLWSSNSPSAQFPTDGTVPLFSAAELAPTYHDGATGAVLGCPHYAQACKLRHPTSGRLYTCRLCCEQDRDMPMKDQDEPLDRYAVTEVMCMMCNTLQPADDRCVNPNCEANGKPFAKYFCKICNLYDDGPNKKIYHCPFCNVCRSGLGLGIDYRHCMRCNACVSLSDDEHRCIPQKLQGSCPICFDDMFQSTEPLRGLRCGHVMHLSCFTNYIRGFHYTCPLCFKSVDDMKDYFALLDAAVRMQPMPAAYLTTLSNIYCQDCGKTGTVQYHFVGKKCLHCGSYNTREMGRTEGTLPPGQAP